LGKSIKIEKFSNQDFENLFKDFFTPLCYFARKYVSDIDSAKEIVHDVFINLWEKRDSIDPEKSIKSYLYTSVNNRCLNHIRDNKKFDKENTEIELINEEHNSVSTDSMEEDELKAKINKSINNLPEKCRKVFVLSRYEELKYHEIAERLEISVKTVEAQMSKALKILRENLKEYVMLIILIFFTFKM
jgi:RNA polymerase sigma-70 factor (ECF subfamily)